MRNNSTPGYTLILFISIFINEYAFAQQADSSYTNLANNIGFKQKINTYHWWFGFLYEKKIGPKSYLLVSEDFKSTFLRTYKDKKKWKDDQKFGIYYSHQFSPKWTGKIISSSLVFSDKMSGITNDIKTSFGTLGLAYNPISLVEISSLSGYKFDRRFDFFDHGPIYGFDVNTRSVELNEYYNRIGFSISGDDFGVRKNNDFNFNYHVAKDFYTDTNDSLSIQWSKKRRDNYDLLTTKELIIESLNEELGTISNKLNYKINDVTKLQLTSVFTSKWTKVSKLNEDEYDDARSKKDFSSFNELNLDLQTERFLGKIKLSYSTERQKNDIPDSLKSSPFSYRFGYVSPDFKMSQLSLGNELNFTISRKDLISTNVLISIFRYDTPDKSNYDDRDELRINANLSEIHHFSPALKLKFNLGVNLKHLVYIYGENSADNNWMRFFYIRPELYYQPDNNFKLKQTFEVLANYVDYDFEQWISPIDIRSYVYRKFTMRNVLNYKFSPTASFSTDYELVLEENGKLFWDRWAEMIITTRQNHYNNSYFDFRILSGLTLSLGTVFYMRKERFHILEATENRNTLSNNDYMSFGPSIKVKYVPHSNLLFLFNGTRRAFDQVNKKRYFINNININFSWYI